MTRKLLYGLILSYLFLGLSPVLAELNPEQVAKTPLRFYQAVNGKDYVTSWNLLTEASKDRLVDLVADEAKLPASDVRQLFDNNDDSLREGFWETFRAEAKPEVYVGFAYKYKGPSPDGYLVEISQPGGDPNSAVDLIVRDENGYKFGLVETYKF